MVPVVQATLGFPIAESLIQRNVLDHRLVSVEPQLGRVRHTSLGLGERKQLSPQSSMLILRMDGHILDPQRRLRQP
jgi:hypothetical protein